MSRLSNGHSLFLSALLLTLLITGCEGGPTTPYDSDFRPGIGSSYTTAWYELDANGELIPGTQDTVTYRLTEINEDIIPGYETYIFSSKYGPYSMKYVERGDIWTLEYVANTSAANHDSLWISFPVATTSSVDQFVGSWDETITGTRIERTTRYATQHDTADMVQVGTELVDVLTATGTFTTIVRTTAGQSVSVDTTERRIEMAFAPSLGFWAGQKIINRSTEQGVINGTVIELVAYDLVEE